MEVRAIAKYVKVQPRKVRIIADEVRGEGALLAAGKLRYHTSKGAQALHKVLVSAVANAVENNGASPETLRIHTIMVDEGPRQKRVSARAMGRGNRILKKTSHITVVVSDDLVVHAKESHGTKPKPRPTFGATGRTKSVAKATAKVEETAPVTPEETTDTDVEEATPVAAVDAPEEQSAPEGNDSGAEASEDKGA